VSYLGKVEHRGAIYVGEHAPIVAPEVWEEVNAELRAGLRDLPNAAYAKQKALLAGRLFCKSCNVPMIATYTAKRGRRYRYYVCQRARQSGWGSCRTKSAPARMIEESVVDQLRVALSDARTREQFDISDADWQEFEANPGVLVRALIGDVRYEGESGTVTLSLTRREASSHAD
jgi:hypothetical protein